MPVFACIDDLRKAYKRRVPRMFYDYTESGAWSEWTFRENLAAFGRHRFRQKVAVDISSRAINSSMLDEPVRMPVALAPVGMTGMQWADGEILAARAAQAFGVPYTLSNMSICSIEDLAAAVREPFWFQLYMMKDRAYIARLMERAHAAGCSALVLTLDLPILGQRHKDLYNGLSVPPSPTLGNILNLMTKPAWGLAMLQTSRRTFGNIVGHVEGVEHLRTLGAWSAEQLDPSMSWSDVDWVRAQWPGKLVIKGILDEEDAQQAMARGADAIVVSNHGGRQLDGAPASLDMLPGIAERVGGRGEVWMDGGIRSGQDILKALALGADGVMVGRAYIYGLGAAGEDGVRRALDIMARELDLSMGFCGVCDVNEVTAGILL